MFGGKTQIIVELPNGIKFYYDPEVIDDRNLVPFLAEEGYNAEQMKGLKVYEETIKEMPIAWETIEAYFDFNPRSICAGCRFNLLPTQKAKRRGAIRFCNKKDQHHFKEPRSCNQKEV